MSGNWKRAHQGTAESAKEAFQMKSNGTKKTYANFASNIGSSCGKGDRSMKKRRMDEHKGGIDRKVTVNQMAPGSIAGSRNVSGTQKDGTRPQKVATSGTNKPKSAKELSQPETRSMLIEKARKEICNKLNEWKAAAASKSLREERRKAEKEMPEAAINAAQLSNVNSINKGGIRNSILGETNNALKHKTGSVPCITIDSDAAVTEMMTMNVPDSDFHDFDKDRSEESFAENQVWAAYDDDDGMPRYYALIHEVISTKPFKLKISWLNSKSSAEFGPLEWVGSGFRKTSGDFRIGKHEINKTLNAFSHLVKWSKGAKGVIQIFPTKGDVWALYRNWSPGWNQLTPDDVIHKYDMVEVLEDYNEEKGVVVSPLVKVPGFRSIFHRHFDPSKIQTVPRVEMFRFSHQVCSYVLTGEEAPNVPTGCLELDTAALPLELLQVITESKEAEAVEMAAVPREPKELSSEKKVDAMDGEGDTISSKDKGFVSFPKPAAREPLLTYSRKIKQKKAAGDTSQAKEEMKPWVDRP